MALWCIYASVKRITIGSADGMSFVRHRDIAWTNADLFSGPLKTHFMSLINAGHFGNASVCWIDDIVLVGSVTGDV